MPETEQIKAAIRMFPISTFPISIDETAKTDYGLGKFVISNKLAKLHSCLYLRIEPMRQQYFL